MTQELRMPFFVASFSTESIVFGVSQFSALATIRNPFLHLVAAGSGS
jgi:hypothetical protein